MARKPSPPGPSTPQIALALQGDLDIFAIHSQWEQIAAQAAASGLPAVLDLSGIGDLDLSGLQLLATLDRDLRAKGGCLALTGLKEAWKDRFNLLGLTDLLQEVPS
ncbi:STAS domain-containing protein [Geothrix sp.]|jgi:anti-anti-sigma factor|uniref:STAS domain-containing protein n=1 Tax=Geothrix sp. TaxID=1962974 RepID=UPI0025BAB80A|nr:STAS domain-containing protein [Geothrix sp.]